MKTATPAGGLRTPKEVLEVVIHHSRFAPNPLGHGGNRRSAQVRELLSQTEAELHTVAQESLLPNNRFQKLGFLIHGIFLALRTPSFALSVPRRSDLYNSSLAHREVLGIAHTFSRQGVFVWESTLAFMYPTVRRLHKLGWTIVGMPHNVESIDQSGDRRVLAWWRFLLESKFFRSLDLLFPISREDAWLYRNAGCTPHTLRYRPASQIRALLESIRSNRVEDDECLCLIVGSALNHYTRDGLERLLTELGGLELFPPVSVVSFGAQDLAVPPGVTLHPSASNELLNALMEKATFLIVLQERGTGMLTRIAEACLAEIPTFANEMAGRSYTHADSDDEQSGKYPDIPSRFKRVTYSEAQVIEEEGRFMEKLKHLLKYSKSAPRFPR